MRLIRTLERVELMKDAGRWSFRQPKKQRGTGGLTKTHWDFLMDEMVIVNLTLACALLIIRQKWMRTDFREERKWKMALAYNISTAVLEWHAAGSLRERLTRGICVLWKPPRTEADAAEDSGNEAGSDQMDVDDNADEPVPNPMVDYNSSDNDDDEADVEQKDIIDALDVSAALRDALDNADAAATVQADEPADISEHVQPKLEERDDTSALRTDDYMDVDAAAEQDPKPSVDGAEPVSKTEEDSGSTIPPGLKPTSSDPVFGAANSLEAPHPKSNVKSAVYAPMRERVVYSDVDKLFLDLDDYDDFVKDLAALSTDDSVIELPPPPPDLAAIFPDLTPFGLLNVPSGPAMEGKKKSDKKDRDDPNKRAEDTSYSRLTPLGEFMYCKPTLLGPLNPAKNWQNGTWLIQQEASSGIENDSSTVAESLCGKPQCPSSWGVNSEAASYTSRSVWRNQAVTGFRKKSCS